MARTASAGSLFRGFLRLGLTAFGGPAMVPHIRSLALQKSWVAEEDFRLGVALTQAIPGATAMQVAAYVGLRAGGSLGCLAAYLGFGLPAFCMILALTVLYAASGETTAILSALAGLAAVVVALVAQAACDFGRRYLATWIDKLLALASGVWLGLGLNPILALVLACLAAAVLYPQITGLPPKLVEAEEPRRGSFRARALRLLAPPVAVLLLLLLFAPELGALAWVMAKVDCFAYGGGYVSLPIMLHEVVHARGWLDQATFMHGIALGQATPGPIVMTAAFVGYLREGLLGALVATLFVFMPSYVILNLTVPFADRLLASALFRRALHGSLVVMVGLMAAMAGRFLVALEPSVLAYGLVLAAFVALERGWPPLLVVPVGAAVGLLPVLFG